MSGYNSMVGLTIRDGVELFLKMNATMHRPHTRTKYRQVAETFIEFIGEDRTVASLTLFDGERYRNWLMAERTLNAGRKSARRGRYSAATVRRKIKDMRTILAWLAKRLPDFDGNPLSDLKLPPLPHRAQQAVSDRSIRLILNAIENRSSVNSCEHLTKLLIARDTAIVHSLRSTGCRVGGMYGCNVADLTVVDGCYEAILFEKSRFEPRPHLRFWDASASRALAEWLAVHPDIENPNAALFVALRAQDSGYGRLSYYSYGDILRNAARAAGVPSTEKVNPHAFRYRAVTEWNRTLGLKTASSLVGHASIKTTATYVVANDDYLREAHRRAEQNR